MSPAPAGMIPVRTATARRAACEPRTRGDDPDLVIRQHIRAAVSPAPAGMIPTQRRLSRRIICEPRTRGDDPTVAVGDGVRSG